MGQRSELERASYLSSFLVIISFIKLILLKIRVRNVKFHITASLVVTRFIIFMKRATDSGAFISYIYKTRSAFFHLTCTKFERNASLTMTRCHSYI
jgi:hypothetical protein